ncbi:hypothetical protein GCM10023198_10400 [Promicromonospora umidemergens]|uniref:Uncharacterized protein n=1 Tax=Promicromonospora umidemergens TaxID=629679 RepID=A0ABP8WNV6_9MICO
MSHHRAARALRTPGAAVMPAAYQTITATAAARAGAIGVPIAIARAAPTTVRTAAITCWPTCMERRAGALDRGVLPVSPHECGVVCAVLMR